MNLAHSPFLLIVLLAGPWLHAQEEPPAETEKSPVLVVSSLDQAFLDLCAEACEKGQAPAVFKCADNDSLILNRVRDPALPPSEFPHILYGVSTVVLSHLADQGLLQAYEPTWKEEVPAGLSDRDQRWFGIFGDPMAILYNRQYFETDDLMKFLPETWDDLGHPRFKGSLLFEQPTPFNPTGYYFASLIDRAEQEHHDQEKGFDQLSRIDNNILRLYNDPEVMLSQLFSGGNGSVSVACMSVIEKCAGLELPAEFCLPEDGFFLYPRGMALMKGAPEEARFVYEIISGKRFLKRWAHKHGCYALTVEDSYTFSIWPGQQISLEFIPTDHDSVRRNIGTWIGTWQNLIHGQGDRKTRVVDDALNTVMTFLIPAALLLVIFTSRGKFKKKRAP